MKCPRCDIELTNGIAIEPGWPGGCFSGLEAINADTLEIIDCLKCSRCGYSDDGRDPRKLMDIENRNK